MTDSFDVVEEYVRDRGNGADDAYATEALEALTTIRSRYEEMEGTVFVQREQLAAAKQFGGVTKAQLKDARDRIQELEKALRVIIGPEDQGPEIEVYRAAGGGYAGLQAIATNALAIYDTSTLGEGSVVRGIRFPKPSGVRVSGNRITGEAGYRPTTPGEEK